MPSASAGGSGAGRVLMADRASGDGVQRGELERLALAAVGAVALTSERADALADALAAKGGLRRDEAREAIESLMGRWRGDVARTGERAGTLLEGTLRELGLVTRGEWDELELRVAQLEHRVRLLERDAPPDA